MGGPGVKEIFNLVKHNRWSLTTHKGLSVNNLSERCACMV